MKTKKLIDYFNNQKIDRLNEVTGGYEVCDEIPLSSGCTKFIVDSNHKMYEFTFCDEEGEYCD